MVVMVEVDKTPKEFLCDLGKLTDFFKALLRGRLLKDKHHRAAGMISFVRSDPAGMTATTHMLCVAQYHTQAVITGSPASHSLRAATLRTEKETAHFPRLSCSYR